MAQKVQVLLLDDVDGSEAEETISFGLDGSSYEIDLNGEHAEELREALSEWTGHARRVGGRSGSGNVRTISSRRPASTANAQVDAKAVRAWAAEQGIEVSDRGRIPSDIIDKYKNRHKIEIPTAAASPAPEAVVTAVEGEPQESKPRGRGRKTTSAARTAKATFSAATA